MKNEIRQDGAGYTGYEYREISVPQEYASLCLDSGIDMVIANGGNMEAVYAIVAGEDVGTRFSRRG